MGSLGLPVAKGWGEDGRGRDRGGTGQPPDPAAGGDGGGDGGMAAAICISAVDASMDGVMGLASTGRMAQPGKPVRLLAIADAVTDVVLAHAASRVARKETADDPH